MAEVKIIGISVSNSLRYYLISGQNIVGLRNEREVILISVSKSLTSGLKMVRLKNQPAINIISWSQPESDFTLTNVWV